MKRFIGYSSDREGEKGRRKDRKGVNHGERVGGMREGGEFQLPVLEDVLHKTTLNTFRIHSWPPKQPSPSLLPPFHTPHWPLVVFLLFGLLLSQLRTLGNCFAALPQLDSSRTMNAFFSDDALWRSSSSSGGGQKGMSKGRRSGHVPLVLSVRKFLIERRHVRQHPV